MRQATAIGLAVLVLVASPLSARSDDDKQVAIAGGVAIGLVVGAVCWVAATAAGADKDEYARRGWLVGASGSYAIEAFDSSGIDSFGIHGGAGYRCHPRFSAEVEVEWLEGSDADVSLPGFGKVSVDFEPVVATTNLKGYLLTGRYQPFLLVGGGAMTAKPDLRDLGLGKQRWTAFAARIGGGIDLYATKHVVMSAGAELVLPFEDLREADYISIGLGLEYRF